MLLPFRRLHSKDFSVLNSNSQCSTLCLQLSQPLQSEHLALAHQLQPLLRIKRVLYVQNAGLP